MHEGENGERKLSVSPIPFNNLLYFLGYPERYRQGLPDLSWSPERIRRKAYLDFISWGCEQGQSVEQEMDFFKLGFRQYIQTRDPSFSKVLENSMILHTSFNQRALEVYLINNLDQSKGARPETFAYRSPQNDFAINVDVEQVREKAKETELWFIRTEYGIPEIKPFIALRAALAYYSFLDAHPERKKPRIFVWWFECGRCFEIKKMPDRSRVEEIVGAATRAMEAGFAGEEGSGEADFQAANSLIEEIARQCEREEKKVRGKKTKEKVEKGLGVKDFKGVLRLGEEIPAEQAVGRSFFCRSCSAPMTFDRRFLGQKDRRGTELVVSIATCTKCGHMNTMILRPTKGIKRYVLEARQLGLEELLSV